MGKQLRSNMKYNQVIQKPKYIMHVGGGGGGVRGGEVIYCTYEGTGEGR